MRSRLTRVALIALLLPLGACVSSRKIAWSRYTEALEQYQGAKWDECRSSFEASIGTGHHLPGVHADYAMVLAREGILAKALVHLKEEAKQGTRATSSPFCSHIGSQHHNEPSR